MFAGNWALFSSYNDLSESKQHFGLFWCLWYQSGADGDFPRPFRQGERTTKISGVWLQHKSAGSILGIGYNQGLLRPWYPWANHNMVAYSQAALIILLLLNPLLDIFSLTGISLSVDRKQFSGRHRQLMKHTVVRIAGVVIAASLTLAATSLGRPVRLVIALALALPSFILMIISRRQLGNAFSVMPEAKILVSTGLYSRIQHPMYLFLDLFLLAVIILLDIPLLLLVWGAVVAVQMLQTRREEKVLTAAFGADYETYRKHTWC
jgi:protein-S-isoprenylcysteine O-methyltransferase Ste14